MMITNLPYMTSPGSISKILGKIIDASVPESFNADFLGTKLGFKGGNHKSFISWAKKCNLLNSDGTPSQLYKNFRNPSSRGEAMKIALKNGYKEVYDRNEYAQDLDRKDFTKLISEITGSPHDNNTVKFIVSTYFFAKDFADFDSSVTPNPPKNNNDLNPNLENGNSDNQNNLDNKDPRNKINLGLNYTFNLVLPKTDDPAVFNAIFKALKENLLDD
jgi:hypothetical protein